MEDVADSDSANLLRILSSRKVMFFHFGRIRTLVDLASQSFHRLIMGKVEIDNFCQVIGDNYLLLFKEMFIT